MFISSSFSPRQGQKRRYFQEIYNKAQNAIFLQFPGKASDEYDAPKMVSGLIINIMTVIHTSKERCYADRCADPSKLINCVPWLRIWALKVIKYWYNEPRNSSRWPKPWSQWLHFEFSPLGLFSNIVHNEKRLKFMHINKPRFLAFTSRSRHFLLLRETNCVAQVEEKNDKLICIRSERLKVLQLWINSVFEWRWVQGQI